MKPQISMNHDTYHKETFNKPCVITNGQVEFTHLGKSHRLTSTCFAKLEGKTVLIDTAFAVTRGGERIGEATYA